MGEFFKDPILLVTVLGTNLPFLSMAAILIFTRSNPKLSSKISVGAIAISAVCAIFLLAKLHSAPPHPIPDALVQLGKVEHLPSAIISIR